MFGPAAMGSECHHPRVFCLRQGKLCRPHFAQILCRELLVTEHLIPGDTGEMRLILQNCFAKTPQ